VVRLVLPFTRINEPISHYMNTFACSFIGNYIHINRYQLKTASLVES